MRAANDGLRFLLELGGLIALASWGFAAHSGIGQWLFGLGIPVAIAVIWVSFVNPNGARVQGDPVRLALEFAIFGSAVAALFASDHSTLGFGLAALTLLHLGLTFPLDQR